MIFNEELLLRKLNDAPNLPIFKIFFYLALNQPQEGIRGFETTKQQLAYDLNLKMTTIFTSLRWLENEIIIHELKQVETVDFMVNPRYVMNNSDFQTRMDEWIRRQRLDVARELRLKKERRLRKRRNEKKQQNSPPQA